MSVKTYTQKIFKKEILIFGIVWGISSALIASYIAVILEALNNIMNVLLNILIWGIGFPGWISMKAPLIGGNMTFTIISSIILALLLSPIAYEAYKIIRKLFNMSPV